MGELIKVPSENFYHKVSKAVGSKLLNKIIKNNGFIAGGACRAWFANEDIKDYDFFFSTKSDYSKFENDTYTENENEFLEDVNISLGDYEKVWISGNANTYKNTETDAIVQFIHNHYNPIEEQVKSFDFTVCAIAYDLNEKCFYTHPKFFDDLNDKRLRLIVNDASMLYPLAELERVAKYSRKGYKIREVDIVTLLLFIGKKFKDIVTYADFKREINGMDIQLIDGIFEQTELKLDGEFSPDDLFGEIKNFVGEEWVE